MSIELSRTLTLGEQIAINDEERVAIDAKDRASLIDVLVHGAHILLEHPYSDELMEKMSNSLGIEITEGTIHAARSLGAELAKGERSISDAATSSADLIREFGLPW